MKINITSLFLTTIIYFTINAGLKLEWSMYDARFDCVVGIVVDDKPIGTGVFISQDTVLTSANVVEDFVDAMDKLSVHIIAKTFNESLPRKVACIVSVFGKDRNRKTSQFWLQHGPQEAKENSPVHDLYTLALKPLDDDMIDKSHYSIAVVNKGNYGRPVTGRYAFMVRMVWESHFIEQDFYMWGGFNYYDKEHIFTGTWMDMEVYGQKEVLVDCDEWIPREWGHFVCIENVNDNPGVPSGAPLFHKGRLLGIGSFMLEKNNETILAFTDLRAYAKKMVVCTNRGRFRNGSNIGFGIMNYTEVYEKEAKFAKRLKF